MHNKNWTEANGAPEGNVMGHLMVWSHVMGHLMKHLAEFLIMRLKFTSEAEQECKSARPSWLLQSK